MNLSLKNGTLKNVMNALEWIHQPSVSFVIVVRRAKNALSVNFANLFTMVRKKNVRFLFGVPLFQGVDAPGFITIVSDVSCARSHLNCWKLVSYAH